MSKYERLSRLLKIITLVKSNSKLTRTDLARLCEVNSVRTIQRDINSLAIAEVPIYWSGEGYEIMPGFFLRPVALTVEEVSCLIRAAKSFQAGAGKESERGIQSAMSKIMATLPEETRERAVALSEEFDHSVEKSTVQGQEPSVGDEPYIETITNREVASRPVLH